MATIRDVAKAAGVGVGTVSRALNSSGYVAPEKREHIQAVARELGYSPNALARNLSKKKSGIVGIAVPDITFPFYGEFVKYAELALHDRGYNTLVRNTLGMPDRVSDAIALVENKVLDGIILNADVTEEESSRLAGLNAVCFERLICPEIPVVASNHIEGGALAAKTLLDAGCRNVVICGARQHTRVYADMRCRECRSVLLSAGISARILEFPAEDITLSACSDFVRQVLREHPDIDGFFSEDIAACCMIFHAARMGIRVPQDLKVIGYDGHTVSTTFVPELTTIRQDPRALAQCCVETLLRRIRGEAVKEKYILPVTLKKGETA